MLRVIRVLHEQSPSHSHTASSLDTFYCVRLHDNSLVCPRSAADINLAKAFNDHSGGSHFCLHYTFVKINNTVTDPIFERSGSGQAFDHVFMFSTFVMLLPLELNRPELYNDIYAVLFLLFAHGDSIKFALCSAYVYV